MSSGNDVILTLEELGEKFKDRYSDNDPDYKKHCSQNNLPPPVIPHWNQRDAGSSRDRRYDRGRQNMSSGNDVILTLEELGEKFKDRYSDNDPDYKKHCSQNNLPPPVIPHWNQRDAGSSRDRRYDRGRQNDRNRNWRGRDNREDFRD
ncbi:unnamed protein product [Calicophoron daubneyi]|uniref:Uncharacterized protein n=1 Tax=Calicophoron daubneyi TaxID=300641 RepID=A0AAV2U0H3_CALDB